MLLIGFLDCRAFLLEKVALHPRKKQEDCSLLMSIYGNFFFSPGSLGLQNLEWDSLEAFCYYLFTKDLFSFCFPFPLPHAVLLVV